MRDPRWKIIAREDQAARRELVGGERERGSKDSHEHGFPKNLSDREQVAENPGLV